MRADKDRVGWGFKALSAAAVLGLGGCLTTEQMAPPVDLLATGGVLAASDTTVLARGRDVYLRRCSGCHAIVSIDAYTLEDWHDLLPEMMDESDLDGGEREALRRYIEAAHGFMMREGRGG